MRKIFFFELFLIAVAACFCGCSTPTRPDKDFGKIKVKPPEKIVYDVIPSTGCSLVTAPEVKVVSGDAADIEVKLVNRSRRELCIKEWYMLDSNNFAVFYRRVPADRPLKPGTPFKQYAPKLVGKPRHAELRLKPENQAVLNVNLPFVSELNPGEMAMFEVYLAINLNTFKLRSKTFTVYAH